LRGSHLRRFAAVVLVISVVTAGGGLLFEQRVSAQTSEDVDEELRDNARLQSEFVAAWLDGHEQTARTVSRAQWLDSRYDSRVRGALEDELAGLPEAYHCLHSVDRETGEVLHSTSDFAEGRTVEEIRSMSERLSDGMTTVEGALASLEEIIDRVEEANAGIQQITDVTDEQAASTEEVVAMVDEVAAAGQQATDEAGNVSTAAGEQAASLTQVADSVESLAGRADELRDLLGEFEVEGGPTEEGPAGPRGGTGRGSPVADGGQDDCEE
jgi:methyl-accepting chemotaxis protein